MGATDLCNMPRMGLLQVLALALFGHTVSAADPVLPTLPDRWQVTVEATIVNKDYTMTQHEVYDYPNNRIHLTTRSPRSKLTTHTLKMLDLGLALTWSGDVNPPTDCVGKPAFHSDDNTNFMAAADGHLRASADFLDFGKNGQTEVYLGSKTVRGIECDAWLSTGSIPNYGWWNLTYYFVASDWSVHGSVHEEIDSVPVRAELVGAKTSDPAHTYHHIYEFVGWVPHSDDLNLIPPAAVSATKGETTEPRCDISVYCTHGGSSDALTEVCANTHEHTMAFLVSRNSTAVCSSAAEAPDPRCPFAQPDDDNTAALAVVVSILSGILIGAVIATAVIKYQSYRARRERTLEHVNLEEPRAVESHVDLEESEGNDDKLDHGASRTL